MRSWPAGPGALWQRTAEVLDAAWDAGITYIDTALSYGLAETFLGEWLREHPGRRQRLMVGSTCGSTYEADWRVDVDVHEAKNHSLEMFERQRGETRAAVRYPTSISFTVSHRTAPP